MRSVLSHFVVAKGKGVVGGTVGSPALQIFNRCLLSMTIATEGY